MLACAPIAALTDVRHPSVTKEHVGKLCGEGGTMALSIGSYVTLTGLKGRADLNDRTGRVLGAAKDGRLPIRVMDECSNRALCEVRVRMDNLALKDSNFLSDVLQSVELLGIILCKLMRWECYGRATGVSHLWRRTALESPALWRHVVCVPAGYTRPSAHSMLNKISS